MTRDFFSPDFLRDMHMASTDLARFWNALDSKTVSSVLVVVAVLVLRWVIVAWMYNSQNVPAHVRNQWKHRIRYITLLFSLVALLIIWAPELRTFAVSIVAFAVALVIAFKEFITCILGAVVRANVEGAEIGGRIHINGVRGDVVSSDLLSTTLLEVNEYGQRTGKTVVLPNSLFIGNPATTESDGDRKYVLLTVGVPMKRGDDVLGMEKTLLEVGKALSDPYMKDAKKHIARFNRKYGFDVPDPEPRIMFDLDDPEKVTVNLRMVVPVSEQHKKRQQILRAVIGAEQWI